MENICLSEELVPVIAILRVQMLRDLELQMHKSDKMSPCDMDLGIPHWDQELETDEGILEMRFQKMSRENRIFYKTHYC